MTSTNLLNLAKIGQLDPVAYSKDLVDRMLATATQRLRDAQFTQNSDETRFDCAYTAIRAVADIGLHINGFRTSTSKPGHHQTAIACCCESRGRLRASHSQRSGKGHRKTANPARLAGALHAGHGDDHAESPGLATCTCFAQGFELIGQAPRWRSHAGKK